MPANSIYAHQMKPICALPGEWLAISAEIIDCLDEPILPGLLARAVSALIDFDYCEQFVYPRNARPIHVYDNSLACAKSGLANYLNATYALNPFFQRSRVGLKSGVYRLRELANNKCPDNKQLKRFRVTAQASEEIGYLTEGWPPGRQELCIALDLPTGELAEITVARGSNSTDFSAEEIAVLALATPFLRSAFRHYWGYARLGHGADGRDLQGGRNLSPREREIAQLLLRGHSSQSISLQLGISTTTVKTHRKHLYSKLGIATHYELLALFLDSRPCRDSGRVLSSARKASASKLQ